MLLDTAFAKVPYFPKTSKKANIVHASFDLGLPRKCEDEEIYNVATKENRFVVTINFKDFKNLVKRNESGILGIPPYLNNEHIDKLISKFISGKDPEDYKGKATKIGFES